MMMMMTKKKTVMNVYEVYILSAASSSLSNASLQPQRRRRRRKKTKAAMMKKRRRKSQSRNTVARSLQKRMPLKVLSKTSPWNARIVVRSLFSLPVNRNSTLKRFVHTSIVIYSVPPTNGVHHCTITLQGFDNKPVRCKACKDAKKNRFEGGGGGGGGYGGRGGRGGGGYGGGGGGCSSRFHCLHYYFEMIYF